MDKLTAASRDVKISLWIERVKHCKASGPTVNQWCQKNGLNIKTYYYWISNNLAENSIRPFTIGRKNWLFSGSPKGAKTSAGIYTLVETAKANGLSPMKYIHYILRDLPAFNF